jgi:4-alpha-glucanotransferase
MTISDGRWRGRFPPFPAEYRASGVLLHVTSLPTAYGIGDVGPAALAWIDRLCEAGQRWWQSLPLGPTGSYNSPYQSLSSFAGNGLLVSPDFLIEDGLLRSEDSEGHSFPTNAVEYDAVISFKYRLLDTAWSNFRSGRRADLRPTYDHFRFEQAEWLEDYALFRALKISHGGACYLDWPEDLARSDPSALARAGRDLAKTIDKVCFCPIPPFPSGRATEGICPCKRGKADRRPALFRFT